jgi:hypothetical protein
MTLGRIPAWLLAAAAGTAWWLVGFLPWLTGGLRREELTGGPFSPDQGLGPVRMAIPLIPEELVLLLTMALLGGVLAGTLARSCRSLPLVAASVVVAGVAPVGLVALVQARGAVARGASGEFASDDRVLTALQAVAVGSTAVGLGLGLLVALGPVALRATTLAAPAVLLPIWLEALLPGETTQITKWLFAVTLGLAFGLSVSRTPRQALGWVPAAVVAWSTQAAVPALDAGGYLIRPGSGLAANPWYPAEVGRDVFEAVFTTSAAHLPTAWLLALVVGCAVAAMRRRNRQPASPAPLEDAHA